MKSEKPPGTKNCSDLWINCSSHLKNFANSRPSVSYLKSFFPSLEQFFLSVSQNNFGDKIPFIHMLFFAIVFHCNRFLMHQKTIAKKSMQINAYNHNVSICKKWWYIVNLERGMKDTCTMTKKYLLLCSDSIFSDSC